MRGMTLLVLLALMGVIAHCVGAVDTVNYEGDLKLSANQERVIEDTVFRISGDIRLEGNAQLTFRNSTIVFSNIHPDIWASMAAIRMHGASRLMLENCSVQGMWEESAEPYVFFYVHDEAALMLREVTGDWGVVHAFQNGSTTISASRLFEIRLFDSSSAKLDEVELAWAMGIDFSGSCAVELSNLRPGDIGSLNLPETAVDASPSLDMQRCTIGAWSIGASDSVSLVLEDSVVDRLHLGFLNPLGTIQGVSAGRFDEWDLGRDCGYAGPLSVSLRDTEISGHVNLALYEGEGPFRIESSVVADVWIQDFAGQVAMVDCAVSAFQIWSSQVALDLPGSTLARGLDVSNSILTLSGDIGIPSDAIIREWEAAGCLRRFEIRVVSPSGTPIADLPGHISGSGKSVPFRTDEDGTAHVWISFDGSNAREELSVSVGEPPGPHGEGSLSLLSTTPIILAVDTQ